MADEGRQGGGSVSGTMTRLCEAGKNLEIWRVHHTDVREQDKNARVMPPEMMERLIQNIRQEERLEQLPFGVLRDGHIELVSGHHRVRGAVAAGILEFPVLVDTRDMRAEWVKSKQLSHNSIGGSDDPRVVAEIFAEIQSVDARLAAFVQVDDSYLRGLGEAMKTLNEELEIRWPVLTFAFLPVQKTRFDALVKRLVKQVPKDADQLWLLPEDIAKQFSKTITDVGRKFDIRTTGNIFAKMVEIVEERLAEPDESDTDSGGDKRAAA